MKKVSVCIYLNKDYGGTIYSFEKCGFDRIKKESDFVIEDTPIEYLNVIDGIEIELLVAYTKDTDNRLIDYFNAISDRMIEVTNDDKYNDVVSDAMAYNRLFLKANCDFICILKPYVFLANNWLVELMFYHETINNSGVISICSKLSNLDYLPLPTKEIESLQRIFIPKDNLVNPNGICFFLRQHLFLVGAFDESVKFIQGDEINQFQIRSTNNWLYNYYIPTQSCIVIQAQNNIDYMYISESKQNIERTINDMKKAKNYYIPLNIS